ncbi:hypothetical protein M433DRAFT_9757 [Acidomyces richmondensis BFW]|nr:hypothetical protein M433DRAFT_9757 [Acidomyces richmondensis BFW]
MILRHPPPELQTRRECGCDTRWASADILDHLIDRGKRPASERAQKALLQKFVRSIQSNSARNYCRGHLQQFAQEMGLRVVNTRTPTLVERLRQMAAAPKSLRAFCNQPLGPLRYFPVAPLHDLVNSASLPQSALAMIITALHLPPDVLIRWTSDGSVNIGGLFEYWK